MYQNEKRTHDEQDQHSIARRQATKLLEKHYHTKGDHLTLLKLFQAWEALPPYEQESWCSERHLHYRAFRTAASVRSQLQDILDQVGRHITLVKSQEPTLDRVRQAVSAGYFMHGARKCLMHNVYRCLREGIAEDKAELVHIHPSSSMANMSPPEFCIYHELVHSSRGFMRYVLEVNENWLKQYKPAKHLKPSECYKLTNRNAPAAVLETEAKSSKPEDSSENTPQFVKLEPTKVTNDAVAAARARYLARKQKK
ncbi:pre-mRNA-splicing factor ATP-dependent RNA helicase [Thraustotheca clavata]|uniref:Pre-mRNA-splicing factor ATP-dependent RNA helicase n=1 Tax=Thraustotheca clavata TaxID=74557 RepID=A0A1V9YV07_9STRA|nr:pre-mRNA-splicing factor ATP-dependent RNA helicase [Thraustotheca clavata]